MNNFFKKTEFKISIFILLLSMIGLSFFLTKTHKTEFAASQKRKPRVYWFIPDGMRADPGTMKVFEWAQNGELPTIKKMMDNGAYGYSVPAFPGHSATNFAVLLTGSYPEKNGVADGAMRIEGFPLEMVSKGGFSSVAKTVPPIWYTLEERGYRFALLSIPGSTPPELSQGLTIRGRWGGWGADYQAVVFQSDDREDVRVRQGYDNRAFGFGVELSKYIKASSPHDWNIKLPASFSPVREIEMENFGTTVYALLVNSKHKNEEYYDTVLFSLDKKTIMTTIQEGEWSSWFPIRLFWETQNDYNHFTPKKMKWERSLSQVPTDTQFRIRAIKLGKKDFFRIRFLYDNLNELVVDPSYMADELKKNLGPMVDFVDNYPAQLIYFPEDRNVFLEEMKMSLDWHKTAAKYLTSLKDYDFIIQDTYTPNQMLTSRWWLNTLDPKGNNFKIASENEKEKSLIEVKEMYKGLDKILEEAWSNLGEDDYIILSSDHGAVPLNTEVRLNNLFAKEKWLTFTYNPKTGEHSVDWAKTKVIFLKMDNIYINPNGLAGNYKPAQGKEYLELRSKVKKLLEGLKDTNGESPMSGIITREESSLWHLPKDRVGDLIVANKVGYNFVESMDKELSLFAPSIVGGYKQGVLAENEMGMWTPFVIVGPKIKKGYQIVKPINHIDQYPTIFTLLGEAIPDFVQGHPLMEIIK